MPDAAPAPVTLWKEYGYRPFQDSWTDVEPRHKGLEDCSDPFKALPAAAFDALLAERDALAARVGAMRGALEFYANENFHDRRNCYCDGGQGCGGCGMSSVDVDGGEKARAALSAPPPSADVERTK